MGQEYQRILSELSNLQSQLLINQLPSILRMSSAVPNDQVSVLSDRILALQQSHFISPIALNISAIKNEINKHKFENTELKELARRQQMDLALIRQKIHDISKEKDNLNKELSQLRAKQMSLGMLINSSNTESRVKQILKQNQQLKQILKQRSDIISVQSAQLQQIKQKQAFYVSQIKALENDNNLFYRDLTNANNQISRLNQQVNALSDSVPSLESTHLKINQTLKLQLMQINKAWQDSNTHAHNLQISNKKIIEELERQKKLNIEIMDENSKLKMVLQSEGQMKKHLEQKLQANQLIINENQYLFRQNIGELQQKTSALKDQINRLNDQIHRQNEHFSLTHEQINQQAKLKLENLQFQLNQTKAKLQGQQTQSNNLNQTINQLKTVHERELEALKLEYQNRIVLITGKANDQKQGYQNQLNVAQGTMAQLQQQISDSQSQVEYYKQYLHENNQLKVQLERALKTRIQRNTETGRNNKWNFQLMQLREDIIRLGRQNNQLKTITLSLLDTTRKWTIKQTNNLVRTILEKKAQCETCLHWQKYESSKKTIAESKSRGQLKSVQDLKALNEKSKLIRAQNQIIGSRIQHIIRD